jgi:hypothetical protein
MRIARKLLFVALAALAAMAFSATTASAIDHTPEETTTIKNESTGVACTTATKTSGGGCTIHATGEVELWGDVFGVSVLGSNCITEFTGRVGGDGKGFVDTVLLSDHAGVNDCTRTPCNLPWDAQAKERLGGHEVLESTFCVTGGPTTEVCHVELPIFKIGPHDYKAAHETTGNDFSTTNEDHIITATAGEIDGGISTDITGTTECRVIGTIDLELKPIEIVH